MILDFSTNHIDTAIAGNLDHIINGPCSSSGCLVDFPTHGGKVDCKLEIFALHRRHKSVIFHAVKPVITTALAVKDKWPTKIGIKSTSDFRN